jgi:RNA-directed DNA polymerase
LKNGIKITGAIIRMEKLAAPNKLQKKMHESFNELIKLIDAGKTNNKELLDLCNKVQGYISAVKTVGKSRELPYYTKEIKRIRETLNK